MAEEKVTQLQLMVLENARTISEQKKRIKALENSADSADAVARLKKEICRQSFTCFRSSQYTCALYSLPQDDTKFLDKFYMAMTTSGYSVMRIIGESDPMYMYGSAADDNTILTSPTRPPGAYELEKIETGHIVIACAGAFLRAYCADKIYEKLVSSGLFSA